MSIGGHHARNSQTDDWLTPLSILDRLGRFDLDPCSPPNRPWDTASRHLTIDDDGLAHPWRGRVWCNPPYSNVAPWMHRMATHGNGIALLFARCDTATWFEHIWPHADAFLFVRGRITFHRADGTLPRRGANSGGPSVLIAYGSHNGGTLRDCGIAGAYVDAAHLTHHHHMPDRPDRPVSTGLFA